MDRLPYSLLFHQTLSTLAGQGELTPQQLAGRILKLEYFHRVSQDDFRMMLRHMLKQDYLEQTPEGGLIIGLKIDRELRRRRITTRLHQRLDEGMADEIRELLKRGVSSERLIRYGLEYKYVTQYVIGQLSYEEMVRLLEIAIHQFAKRQMTYFRGMEERRGVKIHWIDATLPMDEKVKQCIGLYSSATI
jgi:tRNA A37 N6-isopentenylltransferase MiaA